MIRIIRSCLLYMALVSGLYGCSSTELDTFSDTMNCINQHPNNSYAQNNCINAMSQMRQCSTAESSLSAQETAISYSIDNLNRNKRNADAAFEPLYKPDQIYFICESDSSCYDRYIRQAQDSLSHFKQSLYDYDAAVQSYNQTLSYSEFCFVSAHYYEHRDEYSRMADYIEHLQNMINRYQE